MFAKNCRAGFALYTAVAICTGGFNVIYGNRLASSRHLEEGERSASSSLEVWDSAASKPELRVLYESAELD